MPLTLDALNRLHEADFAVTLGETFERASWVVEAVAARRPFATVTALHEAMMGVLDAAPRERQLDYLRGHPDLANKADRAAELTHESASEQASAGLDSLGEVEAARLRDLNDAYRVRFGFPFMICARRHTRESILAELERRLGNDAAMEFSAALREVFYITRLRVAGAVSGEGMPRVDGRLSTHVLDTHAGHPAAGIAIELFELAGEDAWRIATAITNSDGRTDQPLIAGRPLPIGRYELRFAVGDHFRSRGIDSGNPPFLDVVPLRFSIAEPEAHYHVPLICTPWSYSTYRGS